MVAFCEGPFLSRFQERVTYCLDCSVSSHDKKRVSELSRRIFSIRLADCADCVVFSHGKIRVRELSRVFLHEVLIPFLNAPL